MLPLAFKMTLPPLVGCTVISENCAATSRACHSGLAGDELEESGLAASRQPKSFRILSLIVGVKGAPAAGPVICP